jgi:hypothetical protein
MFDSDDSYSHFSFSNKGGKELIVDVQTAISWIAHGSVLLCVSYLSPCNIGFDL